MIRQAHTYLVGALSGVVVIGIAIAAFVVLVSAQVFHDLPIPALSSSDQKAVSQGKALTGLPDRGAANTGGVATGASPSQALADATPAPAGQTGANNSQPQANRQANNATPTRGGTGPAEVVETSPTTSTGGDEGSSGQGGGNTGGSNNSQPSSTSKSPSSSNPGSVGGNNSNSSSGTSGGNGGSGNGTPTTTSGGGAPSTGTSGGGTTTSPPATPVTTAKPSETVTEAVNGTVGTVDEALGGTLSESGVTKVTEEVVEGVAGPESVVGKTVDGVGEVVGGLVGGNGQ
ncbi:MAG: hypothetical protein ACRDPE_12760 [Solirubrobacterales bacterium]